MNRDRSEVNDLLQQSRDYSPVSADPQRSRLGGNTTADESTWNEPSTQSSAYDSGDHGGARWQAKDNLSSAGHGNSPAPPGAFPKGSSTTGYSNQRSHGDDYNDNYSSGVNTQNQLGTNNTTDRRGLGLSSKSDGSAPIENDYSPAQVDNNATMASKGNTTTAISGPPESAYSSTAMEREGADTGNYGSNNYGTGQFDKTDSSATGGINPSSQPMGTNTGTDYSTGQPMGTGSSTDYSTRQTMGTTDQTLGTSDQGMDTTGQGKATTDSSVGPTGQTMGTGSNIGGTGETNKDSSGLSQGEIAGGAALGAGAAGAGAYAASKNKDQPASKGESKVEKRLNALFKRRNSKDKTHDSSLGDQYPHGNLSMPGGNQNMYDQQSKDHTTMDNRGADMNRDNTLGNQGSNMNQNAAAAGSTTGAGAGAYDSGQQGYNMDQNAVAAGTTPGPVTEAHGPGQQDTMDNMDSTGDKSSKTSKHNKGKLAAATGAGAGIGAKLGAMMHRRSSKSKSPEQQNSTGMSQQNDDMSPGGTTNRYGTDQTTGPYGTNQPSDMNKQGSDLDTSQSTGIKNQQGSDWDTTTPTNVNNQGSNWDTNQSTGMNNQGSNWDTNQSTGMNDRGSNWDTNQSTGMNNQGSNWDTNQSTGMNNQGSNWDTNQSTGMNDQATDWNKSSGTGDVTNQQSTGIAGGTTGVAAGGTATGMDSGNNMDPTQNKDSFGTPIPYDPGNNPNTEADMDQSDTHTGAKTAAGVGAGTGLGAMLGLGLGKKKKDAQNQPTTIDSNDNLQQSGDMNNVNAQSAGGLTPNYREGVQGPLGADDASADPNYNNGARANGAQATGTQAIDAQATGTKDGVQTTDAQTTGAQTTGAQTTGAQTTGAQATGDQTTGDQTTGAQTTGDQTTGGQNKAALGAGALGAGALATGAAAAGGQNKGTQSAGQDISPSPNYDKGVQGPVAPGEGEDPTSKEATLVKDKPVGQSQQEEPAPPPFKEGIATKLLGWEMKLQGRYKIFIANLMHNENVKNEGLELIHKGNVVLGKEPYYPDRDGRV